MPRPAARANQRAPGESAPPEFRFEPYRCELLRQHVWAICVRQPDGLWERVNCLDKDAACLGTGCIFTGGENLPFAGQCKKCRSHG
jgi:hypothetical protein